MTVGDTAVNRLMVVLALLREAHKYKEYCNRCQWGSSEEKEFESSWKSQQRVCEVSDI